jgi:hypothetical protein
MATETMVLPTDPKAIREKVEAWHKTHKERYDAFKKQAEGVGKMDLSFFMKLMQFATDCIPQDRLEVCSYIFRLYCADIPLEKETPEFIKQYDPIVAEFLQGGKVLSIHAETGEVKCFKPEEEMAPDNKICLITNDYFDRLKAEQPELLRCYLDDLYAEVDDEGFVTDETGNVRSSEMFVDMAQRMAFVYSMILAPEVLRNMVMIGEHTDDDFSYCLYYYCAFDGGMRQMMTMMRLNLDKQKSGMMGYVAKNLLTQLFVKKSLELGYERDKKGWEATAESEPDESSNLINRILSKIRLPGGKRKKDCLSLDDLLTGDKEGLKDLIRAYRLRQPDTTSLGYLFYLLGGRPSEKTRSMNDPEEIEKKFQLIQKVHIQRCTFGNFCQAITEFLGDKMPSDLKRAREAYLLCKCEEYNITEEAAENYAEYRKGKYRNARMATQKWIPLFNEID